MHISAPDRAVSRAILALRLASDAPAGIGGERRLPTDPRAGLHLNQPHAGPGVRLRRGRFDRGREPSDPSGTLGHHALRLMGPRAESAQTAIRSVAQALAPALFGVVTEIVAGFVPGQAPVGTNPSTVSSQTATGLEVTLLIMLAALVGGGFFLARARASYPSDVATAAASERADAGH